MVIWSGNRRWHKTYVPIPSVPSTPRIREGRARRQPQRKDQEKRKKKKRGEETKDNTNRREDRWLMWASISITSSSYLSRAGVGIATRPPGASVVIFPPASNSVRTHHILFLGFLSVFLLACRGADAYFRAVRGEWTGGCLGSGSWRVGGHLGTRLWTLSVVFRHLGLCGRGIWVGEGWGIGFPEIRGGGLVWSGGPFDFLPDRGSWWVLIVDRVLLEELGAWPPC